MEKRRYRLMLEFETPSEEDLAEALRDLIEGETGCSVPDTTVAENLKDYITGQATSNAEFDHIPIILVESDIHIIDVGKCRRCASPLVDGLCQDITCPHHDYGQHDSWTSE